MSQITNLDNKKKVIAKVYRRLKVRGVDTTQMNEMLYALEKEIEYYRNKIQDMEKAYLNPKPKE